MNGYCPVLQFIRPRGNANLRIILIEIIPMPPIRHSIIHNQRRNRRSRRNKPIRNVFPTHSIQTGDFHSIGSCSEF
jgi:hypothetical protein